jgi:hemin uptake protein HemP
MGEIIMSKEADRFTNRLSAASTADSVDIILGMTGKVVIDHVGDAFHIDSACGDIGCD